MSVLSRWRVRLAVRQRLADAARKRYMNHPTVAGKVLLAQRRAQVAFAQRVVDRQHAGVSAFGVNLIAAFEGCVLHPYRDAVGVWTIGYGHTENVGPGTPGLKDQAAAQALLLEDLDRKYAPPVIALSLPRQGMVDAVVSLVYNCGPGVIAPSTTIGAALHLRDWRSAANAFLLYDHAGGRVLPGLTRRRLAERALFLKEG